MSIFNKYLEMSFNRGKRGTSETRELLNQQREFNQPTPRPHPRGRGLHMQPTIKSDQDAMFDHTIIKIIDQITNLQDYVGPGVDVLGEIVKRLGK